MKNWKNTTLLVIGLLLLIISFQNIALIRLQILFWSARLSLVVLLPLILLIGFTAGRLTRRKRG